MDGTSDQRWLPRDQQKAIAPGNREGVHVFEKKEPTKYHGGRRKAPAPCDLAERDRRPAKS
jgi:hypothetical protein